MKALIVEDEVMAAKALERTLTKNFGDISIAGITGSIEETVEWLKKPENKADIIFMDVELSDGQCFEIFRKVKVDAHVIMTTAYDCYAIKAFEVNSVDYLLKPIGLPGLTRAIERCKYSPVSVDVERIVAAISESNSKGYKERHLVHLNDQIVPVKTSDIAYFFSASKDNHVVTKEGRLYIVDQSLDTIMEDLDKDVFFKISRSCIIAKDTVKSVTKLLGGRLHIVSGINGYGSNQAIKEASPDLTVSRSRVEEFLKWLEK